MSVHYPISAWPHSERPRERLSQWGPQALGDAELMALLIHTGSGKRSALDLAKQCLAMAQEAGGWEKVTAGDLCDLPGIGPAKSAVILASLEFGRRQALQSGRAKAWRFSGSRQTFEFCREHLAGRPQEAFLVAGLDAKNRLLGSRVISLGTLTQSLVHPREVFHPIISMRAAGLILAHNHPSGDPSPSPEDHEVTRRLKGCADLLAITLVDHLVVGKDRYFSYADANWPK